MILRPLYLDKIEPYIDMPFIKILTGVRRSGKSTILKMLMEGLLAQGKTKLLHYNFDSLQYEHLKTATALYAELQAKLSQTEVTYLFLDEVQEVASWEKVVNSLVTDFAVDIYITGSNSRMMSSEISTYLTGRYVSFRVHPLSFAEYLAFKAQYATVQSPQLELPQYLKLGGFPAVHLKAYEMDEAYAIVHDIYNSTIFSDIVRRNEIRKVDQLERIIRFAFDNIGRTFSAASIAKYLKSENRTVNPETVYQYLSKLESAYMLHRCARFDIEGKEILKTQEKFYLADPAFRYSVLGYSDTSVAAMLENLVYLELVRRGFTVYVGKLGEAEVDFVAVKNGEKRYIQVTQMIQTEATEQREYGRLLAIADNYPKYVLRIDAFAGGNYEGITTLHVADFLLQDKI